VERPRLVQPETQVLNAGEIAARGRRTPKLEARAADDERLWWGTARRLVLVALGTALRRGELLARRWRDIDCWSGACTSGRRSYAWPGCLGHKWPKF
jgi:integrase